MLLLTYYAQNYASIIGQGLDRWGTGSEGTPYITRGSVREFQVEHEQNSLSSLD